MPAVIFVFIIGDINFIGSDIIFPASSITAPLGVVKVFRVLFWGCGMGIVDN